MGARKLESGVDWLGERFFGVYAFTHSMQLPSSSIHNPRSAVCEAPRRLISQRGLGGFTHLPLHAPYGGRGASIYVSWNRRSDGGASAVSPMMVGSPLIEGHAGLQGLFGSSLGLHAPMSLTHR